MRFLIAGGYDTQNLGDYASFLGLYKIIRSKKPDSEFIVLSRHPNDEFAHQFDVKTLLNLDHSTKKASVGRIFNGLNEGDKSEHMGRILRELSIADFLVLGNGRLFVDIALGFMRGPLNYFALLVVLARFLNKPIVLSSVTLVHPKTEPGKELFGLILRNANLIVVREQSSAEVAYQYIKNRSKVKVLPDIAFAITPEDAEFKNIPSEFDGAIGVNFRGVNYANMVDSEAEKSIVKRITRLLDSTERDLVFCHQCTYGVDSNITDDRYINRKIYDCLPVSYKKRCHIFDNKWTLAETLAQYSKMHYLFTERRHGFIMSLTQGTGASLICNEENTKAVMETIPLKKNFISYSDDFCPAEIDLIEIEKLTGELRDSLQEYYRLYTSICHGGENIG